MSLPRTLARLVPRRWEVPVRFHYHRWRGRIDPEMALLPALLARDRIAVDVGANLGDYTFALSRVARRVEAFEPLPQCATVIDAARLRGVRVHRVALSDRDGEATLHIPIGARGANTGLASFTDCGAPQERLKVPVRRLDAFGLTEVGLIKIDVEGHESAVLGGAKETIRASRPVLLVEIEQRHRRDCRIEEVFAAIVALGYRGSFLEDGRLVPLEEFSLARHQAPFAVGAPADAVRNTPATRTPHGGFSSPAAAGMDMLGARPARYVNNFIFVPRA